MHRRLHNPKDSESGQALVEFALVLPILLLLLLGIVDLAKAYNYWNDSTNLANTGARFAAVGNSPDGPGTLKSYIANAAPSGELRTRLLVAGNVTICVPSGHTYAVGEPITVTVKSTYAYLDYVAGKTGVVSAPIEGSATTRVEQTGLTGTDVPGTCP